VAVSSIKNATSVVVQVFGRRHDESMGALKRPATENLHIFDRAALQQK
jgi:hypothetical protein